MGDPTCPSCRTSDGYDVEFGDGGGLTLRCLACGHHSDPAWSSQMAAPSMGRPRLSDNEVVARLRARGIKVTGYP